MTRCRNLTRIFTATGVLFAALALPGAAERGVSFEQRVAAQRVLDRLRYSHQEGAARPFDEVHSRRLTEDRVRTQLAESVALEQFWRTPITAEMLQREMERIAESTLFPDRLVEIYAAFDHDPVLVQEALARPALVERMTRSFFATDERIHGEARAEAERLQERLMREEATAEPSQPDGNARLRIVEMVLEEPESHSSQNKVIAEHEDGPHESASSNLATLTSAEYTAERSRLPARTGEVGDVEERGDAFEIRRVLSEDRNSARVAVYSIPKTTWQEWWSANKTRYPESLTRSVARNAVSLLRSPSAGAGPRHPGRPGRGDTGDDAPVPASCPPDDTWNTRPFDTLPRILPKHTAVWSGREMIVWGGRQRGGFRYDPLIDSWRGMSSEGGPEKGAGVWDGEEMIVWDGESRTGARYNPVTDTWRPMSSANSPSSRTDHPLVWTGSELIVWGGYHHPPGALNSGARYDPLTDKWTPIANRDLPPASSRHRAWWTGREMFVWGDYAEGSVLYDPSSDRWRPVRMAGGRLATQGAYAIWIGEGLVVWDLESGWYPVAARYDLASNEWTGYSQETAALLADYTPLAWTGDEIILWSAAWGAAAFNPMTAEWKTVSTLNSGIAADFSAVWTGDQVILWSGSTSRGVRYTPTSDSWTPTAAATAPPSGHSKALWTGNEIIVMGGNPPGASLYDPLAAQWRAASPHASLAPYYSDGVWTGEKLIVYNGETGARYDPLADEWLPMSQENFPIRTHYWSLVWTGSEMILFGGHEDDRGDPRYSDSISRYDPVSDRWTETRIDWRATDDTWGPPVRDRHSAVWTGTEMIIWGGERDWWEDEELGGAGFTPQTGQWRRIDATGGLLGGQEGFWTGREMIVWSRTWEPDPAARYNPLSDSWSAISNQDAPGPWRGQAVEWAQDVLVVWGEKASGTGTGARYDPRSDAWTPITTSNAPSPGGNAVWIGRGLVVFGDEASSPTEHASGIYTVSIDADRDGWTACSGDCNDRNPLIHPAAPDIPGNFADEDCDGVAACDPSAAWASDERFIRCVTRECARLAGAGEFSRRECSVIAARAADHASCGDRTIAPHEVCDGAVVSKTCEDLGYDGGMLFCNDSCDGYNVSSCTTDCGDGARRGFETCDGADLGGATCGSLGYDGGDLSCHASCGGFDHSGCSSTCGDGVRSEREACDGDDFGGQTCESLGFDDGTLTCGPGCDRIEKGGCTTVCGDGLRRGSETCDGDDVGEQTCIRLGFDSGTLGCNATCDGFDAAQCSHCGDGVRQESETCDRDDLGGETCETQGLIGGALKCSYRCDSFDVEECLRCGDGIKDASEECDPEVTDGDSCQARGFNFGWLLCDTDACRITDRWCSVCGDGVRAGDESCDGQDFGSRTCQGQGFSGGVLGCKANCRLDESRCVSVCGNNQIDRGEVCDGRDVGWYSCGAFGFNMGKLGCSATCDAFVTSSCHKFVCGDGIVEGSEECEQGNTGQSTCESLGFKGGDLACTDWCTFDWNSCIQCGNGVREADELCDGDSVGEVTCETLGYPGGDLRCNYSCDGYSTFECSACGNGERNWREECDGAWLGGRTCESLGFLSGSLACKADCKGFDTSACNSDCTLGVCGDGIRHCSEECDGGDFANATCGSLGYTGGLLACNSDCHLDTSACCPDGAGCSSP